jgi:hypothetical protein
MRNLMTKLKRIGCTRATICSAVSDLGCATIPNVVPTSSKNVSAARTVPDTGSA